MQTLEQFINDKIENAEMFRENDPSIRDMYFEIKDVPLDQFKEAAIKYKGNMRDDIVKGRAFMSLCSLGPSRITHVSVTSVPAKLRAAEFLETEAE